MRPTSELVLELRLPPGSASELHQLETELSTLERSCPRLVDAMRRALAAREKGKSHRQVVVRQSERSVIDIAGYVTHLEHSSRLWRLLLLLVEQKQNGQPGIRPGVLADTMWPEPSRHDSKRNRLRVAISELRRLCPDLGVEFRDGVYSIAEATTVAVEP